MSPEQLEAWARTRAAGKWRFVLVMGVALWGTLMWVFQTFVSRLWRTPLEPLSVAEVLLSALVWAVAGVLFGLFLWAWQEKRWRRAQARLPG